MASVLVFAETRLLADSPQVPLAGTELATAMGCPDGLPLIRIRCRGWQRPRLSAGTQLPQVPTKPNGVPLAKMGDQ